MIRTLRFTRHALERMARDGVSRRLVGEVVRRTAGARSRTGEWHHRLMPEALARDPGLGRLDGISVILDRPGGQVVITVYRNTGRWDAPANPPPACVRQRHRGPDRAA